jgi:hypothetical protein
VIVESSGAITLVGGGALPRRDLALATARAPRLVAVDGGANRLVDWGYAPEAVIGDMDSVRSDVRAALPARILHEMAEQDTTDFDKALVGPRAFGAGRRISGCAAGPWAGGSDSTRGASAAALHRHRGCGYRLSRANGIGPDVDHRGPSVIVPDGAGHGAQYRPAVAH